MGAAGRLLNSLRRFPSTCQPFGARSSHSNSTAAISRRASSAARGRAEDRHISRLAAALPDRRECARAPSPLEQCSPMTACPLPAASAIPPKNTYPPPPQRPHNRCRPMHAGARSRGVLECAASDRFRRYGTANAGYCLRRTPTSSGQPEERACSPVMPGQRMHAQSSVPRDERPERGGPLGRVFHVTTDRESGPHGSFLGKTHHT